MAIVTVTADNIEKEHICCAISDKKGKNCVGSKKNGLKTDLKMVLYLKNLMKEEKFLFNIYPLRRLLFQL